MGLKCKLRSLFVTYERRGHMPTPCNLPLFQPWTGPGLRPCRMPQVPVSNHRATALSKPVERPRRPIRKAPEWYHPAQILYGELNILRSLLLLSTNSRRYSLSAVKKKHPRVRLLSSIAPTFPLPRSGELQAKDTKRKSESALCSPGVQTGLQD